MAQIKITAAITSLAAGIPAFGFFKGKNGESIIAEPVVSGDTVTYFVPDTDHNREAFTRNLEPSGIFSAEDINQKAAEPFSVKANSNANADPDDAEAKKAAATAKRAAEAQAKKAAATAKK